MFPPGEEKVVSCVRDWPDGNETHFFFFGTQEEDISQPPLLLAWSYGRAMVIERQLEVIDNIFVINCKIFWKTFHIFYLHYSADLEQKFVFFGRESHKMSELEFLRHCLEEKCSEEPPDMKPNFDLSKK